ncbi:NAD(P)H-dependent oxidoreductase [Oceanobacillus piezotolerans]|uniref:NAD(P)H-dependent oxidoreductase n=1 Tax=Oceanobacillus piezotolerans TaxID=2448030 RepID=A0A498D5F3_9BACI|nr:NADPH-dependent FMN reductase [Oceanobacillus piezotolerans]RLL44909.1 NAD(P)H-dependent oxidoreductase [Oceanobacillus piezotolerans]
MKIVAMVGSNRSDSYNMQLATFMQKRYAQKVEIEILPINKLPFYNQDDELNPPEIVKEIRNKIKESDGILFVTPEYNASIPGVLKNAIDWFSRVEKVMVNKPAMIVGASMGALGTVKAQLQLRQILNSQGVSTLTLPGNEVYVGSVHEKIDENGNLIDESTIQFIDTVVDNFMNWIEKVVIYASAY